MMASMHKRVFGAFLASTAFVGSAALLHAQVAPHDATNDSNATNAAIPGNGEIVVTAQRRAQNVLQVPMSIVAESGQSLIDNGITRFSDLQFTTPGYNVADSTGYEQVFIRGVGNSIFVGADPSVATFIDDVPRIYGSLVNHFPDVERVEILKGAQGGLYGRNATGGVVNIITIQPTTDRLKADFRMSYGEKNTFDVTGFVNVPVSDSVALTVAGERATHDPYDRNIASSTPYNASMFPVNNAAGPGTASYIGTPAQTAAFLNSGIHNVDVDNENFYSTSAKLLIRPANNFKVTFAGDYSHKNDSAGNSSFNASPAGVTPTVIALVNGFLGASVPFAGGLPGVVQGNPPKFRVNNGNPGFAFLEDYGFSGTAVLNLPGVDLTSITAYRQQHTHLITDLSGSSVPVFDADVDVHKHYVYQELRAISTFSGPLRLLGGATYLNSHFEGLTTLDYLLSPLSNHQSSPLNAFLLNSPVTHSFDRVRNWSIYAQAEYDLTPKLTLTASGRYVHETNTADFPGDTTHTPPSSATLAQGKVLPSATLSYKLEGRGNVYLRYARGFKAGGVNPVAAPSSFPIPTDGSTFKGEIVDTFEGGIRAPLANHKLDFTAAVFYNRYNNLQVAAHAELAYSSIIEAIVNAGKARTYGVESSLDWHVAKPLTLGVAAGYLNAKYTRFSLPVTSPQVLVPFDLSGTRMTNAPKLQLSLTAALDQPISNRLDVTGNVLVTHSSGFLWGQSGLPGFLPDATEPGYWLANVRVGLRTSDKRYSISAFANNLFNSRYTTYGSSAAATGTLLTWGDPRIVGVEVGAKF